MSYYVNLQVAWDGEGPDPFTRRAQEEVISLVEEFLRNEDRDGRLEWLDEFRAAFAGKTGAIKYLDDQWTESLLAYVSRRFPGTGFWARGIGEEFPDVWVLHVRDGETLYAASLGLERVVVPGAGVTVPAWPEALELSRVVSEAGLLRFVREILHEQPPTAAVGALILKPRKSKKPRALVYVGPLDQDGSERISDLVESRHDVEVVRDPRRLLKRPLATAEQPLGY